MPTHKLRLIRVEAHLAVCRLGPAMDISSWAFSGPSSSITRTPVELSIVCDESAVPDDIRAERGLGAPAGRRDHGLGRAVEALRAAGQDVE
jgi:hypothetical protein